MFHTRYFFWTAALAKLSLAYRKSQLRVSVCLPKFDPLTEQLLFQLQANGLVGHFERANRFSSHTVTVVLYLRYGNRRPAVRLWDYLRQPLAHDPVPLSALQQALGRSAGRGLILLTSSGLLTASQCVARGCGGLLVLGWTVG